MKTQKEKRIIQPDRRQLLVPVPFSLCYAAFIVLGNWQKSAEYSNLQNIGRLLLWALVSYGVLLILCLAVSQRDILWRRLWDRSRKGSSGRLSLLGRKLTAQGSRPGKWYVFLGFFLLCLLGCLPYYLMYYPTWFNNDAVWQMEQILGWKARSNHHPFFHTLIMRFFIVIGYKFSGTYTGAVGFYTFCQMTVVSLTFAFCLYILYRKGTRFCWIILALAFYMVLPVHGMLSICMGKDAFFVSALLLFAWMSHTFDLERERRYRQWSLYFLTGLLVCLLRSNGILIFAGTAFVKIFCKCCERRKKGRTDRSPGEESAVPVRSLTCAVAVLVCYLLYQGPVLGALQVEPPDTIEGLTMPTQHLLCAYMRGGSLSEEDVAMIEQVVPLDRMEEYYNPYLFDVTKNLIREEGNQEIIAEKKWEYFKLWLRVGLRNPMLYLEAEVRQTAGYWAYRVPHYQYLYTEYFMVDNPFGITNERKLFTYDESLAMGEFLTRFQDLYNKVWSLGLNTWVMLFGLCYLAWRRENAMCYVPFMMLLLSLLLAAPVYNEFRYAYGLFAAFPLLFGYTFAPSHGPSYGEREGAGEEGNDEKVV